MAAMKVSCSFGRFALLKQSFQLLPAAFGKSRSLSTASKNEPLTQSKGRYMVTLIPGDGVGPELVHSVKRVFSAAGAPVDWDEIPISDMSYGSRYTLDDVVQSMKKTGVGLKVFYTTLQTCESLSERVVFKHVMLISSRGIDYTIKYHQSRSLVSQSKMKTELDLFANVVHCKSLPGYNTRHSNVDMIIIREQQKENTPVWNMRVYQEL
ncbi:Isocitrate dehydrogenase [NAD] subunit beta, mitochondrial [Desmophyllum pertusum]|uniref:Isocitrate dehydrogenase [NAD] subunit beta, mitochondrial n=1 Tax=Desmophyllum pertusum TaxID=174260 RepID=A0A9W9YDP0_9CNID|nr:Isocitrate dehydrogenase [NAD] subunit beta, mitochondrial [Desmophyllum pertusum]